MANILHRDTIAMIVGGKTFERGEQCFQSGRVLGVESGTGELCGVVRPNEAGRTPYEVRIWIRDDGLAYECTCPVGTSRQFCKHAVAVALAHLQKDEQRGERELAALRVELMNVSIGALLDGLVEHARLDRSLLDALRRNLPARVSGALAPQVEGIGLAATWVHGLPRDPVDRISGTRRVRWARRALDGLRAETQYRSRWVRPCRADRDELFCVTTFGCWSYPCTYPSGLASNPGTVRPYGAERFALCQSRSHIARQRDRDSRYRSRMRYVAMMILLWACGSNPTSKPDASTHGDAPHPDAAIDAPVMIDASPDADTSAITTTCADVCDALATCFMLPPDPGCNTGCEADLGDCTPEQVQTIDACKTEMCGDAMDSPIVTCIQAVTCVNM